MIEIEKELKSQVPGIVTKINQFARNSKNEAEFRAKISSLVEELTNKVKLNLFPKEEYTLINGRADAVYNRLIIEYEHPGRLRNKNHHSANKQAIDQIKKIH